MKLMLFFTVLFLSQVSIGQTLKAGSVAPPIKASQWVKGTPVNNFENGKVYVVEFWSTWCGPCKKSIPHLTKLAKQYGSDVTVIGMSVLENDASLVKPFVDQMGDKMNYTVAIDEQKSATNHEGFMTDNWMRPAGLNGIPAAFIVGKTGNIEWVGNPVNMDKALGLL